MIKSRIATMAAALLFGCLLVFQTMTVTAQTPPEWSLVAPAGEGFSVRMPVKPDEQTDRVPLEGFTYQTRLYTSADPSDRMFYMVVMQEFSSIVSALEATKRFDNFMTGFNEGMVKTMGTNGATLEFKQGRDLDLKGHLGRQYTLTLGSKPGVLRAFDSKNRIYVLIAIGGADGNTNINRFFDSFEITPAPAPVPKPIASD